MLDSVFVKVLPVCVVGMDWLIWLFLCGAKSVEMQAVELMQASTAVRVSSSATLGLGRVAHSVLPNPKCGTKRFSELIL